MELQDPAATLSAAVNESLNEAIGSAGGMLTGFLGIATYIDEEGSRCWTIFRGDDRNLILNTGMSKVLADSVEAEFCQAIFDGDEIDGEA